MTKTKLASVLDVVHLEGEGPELKTYAYLLHIYWLFS